MTHPSEDSERPDQDHRPSPELSIVHFMESSGNSSWEQETSRKEKTKLIVTTKCFKIVVRSLACLSKPGFVVAGAVHVEN